MKPSEVGCAPPESGPVRSDREAASNQPDLFAERGVVTRQHAPKPMASSAPKPVERLTDDELLERVPNAGPSNVEAVCSDLVVRSLPAAVPALEALGLRGDAKARQPLYYELARFPSAEVIEAITAVWDEDAIVYLGRCARRHPQLAGLVLDALREMGNPRAATVARHLESATGGSTPPGE